MLAVAQTWSASTSNRGVALSSRCTRIDQRTVVGRVMRAVGALTKA